MNTKETKTSKNNNKQSKNMSQMTKANICAELTTNRLWSICVLKNYIYC